MYFKQIQAIVDGIKTQTRRVVKPNELGDLNLGARETYSAVHSTHKNGSALRLKWQVGRDYAVSPGRGKPGLWWNPVTKEVAIPYTTKRYKSDLPQMLKRDLRAKGYRPLRIRFTDIRRESLQAISEADAIAEGYPHTHPKPGITILPPVSWYAELWTAINGKGSWAANPDVWALTFEVVR